MPAKTVIRPAKLAAPFGVWSPAVVAQGTRQLYISGATARDSDGNVVGIGDMSAQTRQVCENLRDIVTAAGGTLADIVSVTVFVTDVELFNEIHAVRREFFTTDPPASTMVEVSRLVDEQCMIEINAVALLD